MSLEYKDLVGMMKPTIHIDEFSAKMGEDEDIVVASFFIRDKQAAKDLMAWFEKGYDFVVDSDVSPGEIKPGRFLVYVELRRRSSVADKINELLDDLSTLTDYEADEWRMHYDDKEYPWSVEEFNKLVPLSPKEYRARHENDLNEMRIAAGIQPRAIHEKDSLLKSLQHAAGI